MMAFHAGVSSYRGHTNLNTGFLGAEFLLPGEWVYGDFLKEMRTGDVGFTDAQYDAGGWLYANWMVEHNFARDWIVSHSIVADDYVRGKGKGKRDPGVGFRHGRLTINIDRWVKELSK